MSIPLAGEWTLPRFGGDSGAQVRIRTARGQHLLKSNTAVPSSVVRRNGFFSNLEDMCYSNALRLMVWGKRVTPCTLPVKDMLNSAQSRFLALTAC